jgi:hypothetical protein
MAKLLACVVLIIWSTSAFAWDAAGHKVVGSIADQMLSTNAQHQVAQILGYDLKTAGPWLDCVKSVEKQDDAGTFAYKVDQRYEKPCTPFANDHGRMEDYVKRNWFDCRYPPQGTDRGCHNTYHFDDVAVQRNGFDRNFQGTNDHDIVSAINAAIAVLLDRPAPRPFSIIDKKEALFLLAHLLGDLHQPLHVSAVYLDKSGNPVDPDINHTIDPSTDTAGGNFITDQSLPTGNNSFHIGDWDSVPAELESSQAFTPELLAMARLVPADSGQIEGWSGVWATDTILAAHTAFSGLQFAPNPQGSGWIVSFVNGRDSYVRDTDDLKRKQLAKAGARLAELLNTIWP